MDDDLIPDDDLEELEELEDLDELEEMQDFGDLEELLEEEPGKEEIPLSAAEKERNAARLLEASKREQEERKREKREARMKGARKVRDPKKEMIKGVSVVLLTVSIALGIFYVAWQDYNSDMDSKYDEQVYNAIRDENVYYFEHNNTVVYVNETGTVTGDDAARSYKEYYRMNGDYAQRINAGPFVIELNWVYFLVLGMLVITGPNGALRRSQINNLREKEEKFPDFIRDLAEFWKGGLSMTVAVDTLSKGDYGAMDEEVEFMATQLSWGVAFNEVMRMFLERVHTGLIERSIALIEEANKAGGKISDILLNVAHDAQEIKMLDREREVTMKSYIFVTLISFFIYVVIIVVMAYVFIPAIADSTEDLDIESGFGGVQIQAFDPALIALVFFSSVLVQAIGGGVNAGIMGEGNIGASLWWITIFLIIGTAIFQLAGVQMGMG